MKKLFIATMVLAGTAMGFAKDNVQNLNSFDKNLNKTEIVSNFEVTTNTFTSSVKTQKFIEDCTVITAAYAMVNGELELVSVCETTSPCILEEPGLRIAVVIV